MATVFVYGPDSLQARVYDRVGSSKVLRGATLEGYRLVFDKPNMKEAKEGLANLHADREATTFGVVYELSDKQVERLESYYGGYKRATVRPKLVPDEDGASQSLQAITLIARRTKAKLRPSKEAIELTQKGAEENAAPEAFMKELEKLEAYDG